MSKMLSFVKECGADLEDKEGMSELLEESSKKITWS